MTEQTIYQRERRSAHPEKALANGKVSKRVECKLWPPAHFFKCSCCKAQAIDYHHEDYSLWWSVEPLCRKCHHRRHGSGTAVLTEAQVKIIKSSKGSQRYMAERFGTTQATVSRIRSGKIWQHINCD